MKVFVLNEDSTPLAPCSFKRAKQLMKRGCARCVCTTPFTIKMKRPPSGTVVPEIDASIVPSSFKIGISVIIVKTGEVLYQSQIKLRTDISKKMKRRSSYRRNRRNRKTRYRQCRFLNRKSDRRFTPTVKSKLDTHHREVKRLENLLPISNWIVVKENKFKGNWTKGTLDEQWLNLQRQTFERDGFKCRHCNGKSKNFELHAHHLIHRADGGEDELDNIVTLCKTCHVEYHQGKLILKIGKNKFKGKIDTELSIIRKNLKINNEIIKYGFQIKAKRQELDYPVSPVHNSLSCFDNIKSCLATVFNYSCCSRGDYQQTKGVRSQMKIPTGKIMGFRKFDKVKFKDNIYFIKGRMSSGYVLLQDSFEKYMVFKPIPKLKLLTRVSSRKSWIMKDEVIANFS